MHRFVYYLAGSQDSKRNTSCGTPSGDSQGRNSLGFEPCMQNSRERHEGISCMHGMFSTSYNLSDLNRAARATMQWEINKADSLSYWRCIQPFRQRCRETTCMRCSCTTPQDAWLRNIITRANFEMGISQAK